jgi:UDP-MurNAc hydroxylase
MKLTFFQSSAVMIETKGVKILCDPWLVDGELYGSWNHYPPIDFQPQNFNDVDFIYLSHIHQDHFSKKSLSKLNKDIPVIIHNFENKVLRENIKEMGFKVNELNHNDRTHLKNQVFINILAADNCDPSICYKYFGCAPLESKYGSTSIDTMSVIDDQDNVLVNTNDCPFELSFTAATTLKEKYSKIDMLLVGYTSASAYPQCFTLSEAEKIREKERMQQDFLKKAENYVNLFEPNYFMPFAGRYTLAGKLAPLNDYRGVTELDDAFSYFTNSKNIDVEKSKCIILNPGSIFDTETGQPSEPYKKIDKIQKQQYIQNVLAKRKLDYESEQEPEIDEIKSLIGKCYERFERKRKELRFSSETTVLIKLSSEEFLAISCNGNGWKIIKQKNIDDYKNYVKLSLDTRLLKWILSGPRYAHWNVAENGSHITFERTPNVYERGLYYCLAFFYA